MQENLISTIDRINNKIFAINSKTGVVTPNLAAHIMHQRQYALRDRYGKFVDGVHVNPKVKKAGIKTLRKVMDKNELKFHTYLPILPTPLHVPSSSSDSDSDSDMDKKGNWRY